MKLPNVAFVTTDQALHDGIASVNSAEFVAWIGADCESLFKSLLGRTIDILVIDIDTPNLDTLHVIRFLFELLNVPIITLGSSQNLISHTDLLHAGADRNLIKPIDINDLLANIRAIVRRGLSKKNLDFDANSWRLDCHRWLLFAPNGIDLELSGSEIIVIKALIEAGGLALSKVVLTQRVYGCDESKQIGSIDMLICRLRKKARKTFDHELPIKNVRLNGYVFASPAVLV
jgi:DNA-binding response OmpR family regulator